MSSYNFVTDESTRIEALATDRSFIVQAPAGSGKTSLLVQRFIKLLAICNDPEECLAITFTNKAAFEMRSRVLREIEQQQLKFKKIIYNKILENPNRLKILTIDAFCATLVQKMPILARLDVNFKVTENPKLLYVQAVDDLLQDPDQAEILHYLANDYKVIKNLLINMLAKREQWLPLIVPMMQAQQQSVNLKNILEQNLVLAIEDSLTKLLSYLPKIHYQNKIIHFAKQAANTLKKSNIKNDIWFCDKLIDHWPQAIITDLPIWRGLTELLLNKQGKPRSTVNFKQGFVAASKLKHIEDKKLAAKLKVEMEWLLQELITNEPMFLKSLQQINILPDIYYSEDTWKFLQSLFKLLPKLVANLMVVFQEQQQIDFTQVAISAVQALGTEEEPTDLALAMDYKINHILVDEFQDTSVLQFKLLEKLIINWHDGDGRTIFFVGDPMQSIYRFRQAEVGLFLKVQQYGLANIKLQNLYLSTNFRSSDVIVNNLNKLFINIFPKQSDITVGGVTYSMAQANKLTGGEVKFFIVENSKLEAYYIVELIKNIKKDLNGTIAILVRAKQHANCIIQALRDNNIKFQANDLELLSDQAVICDLISLTRAILHQNDIIAWLALLRGPLVGLNLFDIHALRELSLEPLFKELQNYKENKFLSEEAKIRLNYIMPILVDAINQRENIVNLSVLIKKTWVKLGGPLLIQSYELELVENFFHQLLKINNFSNSYVIEELINQQFVSVSQAVIDIDSVQLMTIHKAKGLEFDTVIVPGLSKTKLSSKSQLLLWEERCSKKNNNNYLLFAPIKAIDLNNKNNNSMYDFMKFSQEQCDIYEEQRLLYVAMTRAKTKFYGFSNGKVKHSKNFFKFLRSLITLEKFSSLNTNEESFSNQNSKSLIMRRLPLSWYNN